MVDTVKHGPHWWRIGPHWERVVHTEGNLTYGSSDWCLDANSPTESRVGRDELLLYLKGCCDPLGELRLGEGGNGLGRMTHDDPLGPSSTSTISIRSYWSP